MTHDNAAAIIFDCEYTAWEGSLARYWSGDNEDPEVIEIGAVKLCVEGEGLILGPEFRVLVKPTRRPRLSEYIINLTGIDQEMLNRKGLEFPRAIEKFSRFVVGCGMLCSNGEDWPFLDRNCEINRVTNPLSQMKYVNLRPLFAEHLGFPEDSEELHSHQLGGSGGVSETSRFVPGTPHNALDDARAAARQICAMRESLSLEKLFSSLPHLKG